MKPLVVLLPVFNAQKYLRQTLLSVAAQSFTDFDILAIDDGSTDDSPQILREFPDPRLVIRTHSKNLGLIATLNEGILHSDAPFIARMDADDLMDGNRLARQLAAMEKNKNLCMLGSARLDINSEGREIRRHHAPPVDPNVIAWKLLTGNFIPHPSVVFRRKGLPEDLYDPRFPHSEDYGAWLKIARVGEIGMLREPLLHYRVHGESVGRTHSQVQIDSSLRALEDHLQIQWQTNFSLESLKAWTTPQDCDLTKLPADFEALVAWMDPRGSHFSRLLPSATDRFRARWHYFRRLVLLTKLAGPISPFPALIARSVAPTFIF